MSCDYFCRISLTMMIAVASDSSRDPSIHVSFGGTEYGSTSAHPHHMAAQPHYNHRPPGLAASQPCGWSLPACIMQLLGSSVHVLKGRGHATRIIPPATNCKSTMIRPPGSRDDGILSSPMRVPASNPILLIRILLAPGTGVSCSLVYHVVMSRRPFSRKFRRLPLVRFRARDGDGCWLLQRQPAGRFVEVVVLAGRFAASPQLSSAQLLPAFSI